MSEIIRGRLLAESIRKKVAERLAKREQPLGLAVILVGDNPASHLYVKLKEEAAKEVGIYVEKILYTPETPTKELIRKIHELNKRPDIHGILVQLPLPTQDEDDVIASIDPKKDVDGFHEQNRHALLNNQSGLVPPVALAIMKLIEATRQPLNGRHAIIVSNHQIFADPLIHLLKEQGAQGLFLPRISSAITAKLCVADIIVIAVGEANFLKPEMVKEGAILIDVGTNELNGRTVGDISKEASAKAGFVSPVPGGVGPLTVAYLLQNVLKAAQLQS